MEKEIRRAKRAGTPLSLLMIDIDAFKAYNDHYGHQQGDHSLIKVSGALSQMLQRPLDMIARYGGEEFAVLLEGVGRDHALAAAERLRQAIAAVKVTCGEDIIAPTASVGVARLSPGDTQFDQLLIRADRALYRAKAQGRNRVVIADQDAEPIGLPSSASER